jgi:hypothetical protein
MGATGGGWCICIAPDKASTLTAEVTAEGEYPMDSSSCTCGLLSSAAIASKCSTVAVGTADGTGFACSVVAIETVEELSISLTGND